MPPHLTQGGKLVHGCGISDCNTTIMDSSGVYRKCPVYCKWRSMIERGYCKKFKAKYPTYADVFVNSEWKYLSKFKEWVLPQKWAGLELDKDILVVGNKEYSSETCAFVPKYVNYSLLLGSSSKTSGQPIGVQYVPFDYRYPDKAIPNPYSVRLNDGHGRSKYIGRFNCPNRAHRAWQLAKIEALHYTIERYRQDECYRLDIELALSGRVSALLEHNRLGVETTFI